MKVCVLDIASKNAVQYNPSLCKGLVSKGIDVTLISTKLYCEPDGYKYLKLVSLLPESWITRDFMVKRLLRALEILINYFVVIVYIIIMQPDILHIQWLPFISKNNFDKLFLMALKIVTLFKLKIILTAHNIYPHDISLNGKISYKNRFIGVNRIIDGYIVHLESAKKQLAIEFDIPESKIFVAYHGIYKPDASFNTTQVNNDGKEHIILYGFQTPYKGADILIDAISYLPNDYQEKVAVTIVGDTDSTLYKNYSSKAQSLGIQWINHFVSDKELYDLISESTLIVLPYRSISQSGVLLLALSYEKPILTSDLPSFKETLEGYPDNYFFKGGDAHSFSTLIKEYLDGNIDKNYQKKTISILNKKYSWDSTAESTVKAYMSL